MIAPESIQQVIGRSDIVDVVGQFVKLRKRGINYIGNCPFHNEKTPSFNVNPAKGIFKCFGCGKGGDVVTFIEEYEKFSFVEAIRWLANYYHIDLVESETTDEYKQHIQTEESLRIINEFAAKYFENTLHQTEEGKLIGAAYFKERGFRQNIIEQFRLGYSLDKWDAFVQEATGQGFNLELLEKLGLVKTKDGRSYDNYRGRVMFPIFSATGKILGFGARILKKQDNAPKYVNSPENELYVKNKVLYGLYQSRQSINKLDECFLVEGYTDVISLHQAGITNVVASSGTSLTDGQLKLIGNLTKNLTILYDGDAAGVKAAMRGLDMALSESFNVKLVLLPEGEDPDSFVQQQGAEQFRTYIDQHKQDVIGFRLEVGLKEVGTDPIKKTKLVNEIAETVSKIDKIEDFALQDYYIKESVKRLNIDEESFITLVNKFVRERINQEKKASPRVEPDPLDEFSNEQITDTAIQDGIATLSNEHKEEWQLVKILIEYGAKSYKESTVAQHFFETIDPEILENTLTRQIVLEYYTYWQQEGKVPETAHFTSHIDKAVRQKAADMLQVLYVPSTNWQDMHKIEVPYGDQIYQDEVDSSFAYFELKLIRKLIFENMQQMQTEQELSNILTLQKTHQLLKAREKELMTIVIVK